MKSSVWQTGPVLWGGEERAQRMGEHAPTTGYRQPELHDDPSLTDPALNVSSRRRTRLKNSPWTMNSIAQGALRLKKASPKGRFNQGMHCTRVKQYKTKRSGHIVPSPWNSYTVPFKKRYKINAQQRLNYKNTSPPAYNLKHTVQDRVKLVITHHEPAMCAKIFFSWLVFPYIFIQSMILTEILRAASFYPNQCKNHRLAERSLQINQPNHFGRWLGITHLIRESFY
jgi:hypothetical protein